MTRLKKTAMLGILASFAMGVASSVYAQASGAAANGVAPVQKCADLVNLKIPSSTMVIAKAEEVPTAPAGTVRASGLSPDTIPVAIPSYCRADGTIDPRTGVDGKSYAISFCHRIAG